MDVRVHEWLKPEAYSHWVCPHMETLLGKLKAGGNQIAAVGLANYRSPEAIIFVSQPVLESVAKEVAAVSPTLQMSFDGLGNLDDVSCTEHFVSMRHSGRPA